MRLTRAPGVLDGAAVALVAALATAVGLPLAVSLLPIGLALRGVIALVAGGYVLYLLARRGRAVGVPSAIAAWLLGTLLIAVCLPSVATTLVAHVLLVWALRAALYHTRPLAALADLGLCAGGVLFALWAVQRTHSLSVGVWCLLLSQIAFVWLPGVRGRVNRRLSPRFDAAARAATDALRLLDRPTQL